MANPRVAILMGSKNDWESMKPAADALEALGFESDARVISAHRTPERHHQYVTSAPERGIELFICGAGFAAHLAGVTAALTPLPVLGVPLDSSAPRRPRRPAGDRADARRHPGRHLRHRQGRRENAGLFAAAILAGRDPEVAKKLDEYRADQTAKVPETPF